VERTAELAAGFHVAPYEDLAQVVLDGSRADELPAADRGIGLLVGCQPCDLRLLRGTTQDLGFVACERGERKQALRRSSSQHQRRSLLGRSSSGSFLGARSASRSEQFEDDVTVGVGTSSD
jgi:hypothetical protein